MKIFSHLYQKVLTWSKSRRAPYFLAGVSFAESSFFPIPPDVMLISMGMVKPQSVWQYALITTFFSVLGGIFGYFIGAYAIHLLLPLIHSVGYYESYQMVQQYFVLYGIAFIFIAGFTPIPYKLFTIAAGSMHMSLIAFILTSVVGRGMRFFLVSGLMYYKGEKIAQHLEKHIEWLGWMVLAIVLVLYGVMKLWH